MNTKKKYTFSVKKELLFQLNSSQTYHHYFFILALLFCYSSIAKADFTTTVQSVHSGKCLEVAGGSNANGANVQQWDCADVDQQRLTFIPVANKPDVYTIQFEHSDQCLDVSGGSTENAASLIQWPCHGGLNQQFKLNSEGNNTYSLTIQHSNRVVDVEGISTANGADIHQWDWLNANNQKWVLSNSVDPVIGDPITSDEFTTAVQSINSGKCLDVVGGSNANGANVQQWDCADVDQQRLIFIPVANKPDVYTIQFGHSGQCLDVSGGSTENAASLIQWPCHGGLNQQFKLNSEGNNTYSLTIQHSNRVVDVEGISTANGADIHQWDWLNANNQKWMLVDINDDPVDPVDDPNSTAIKGQWSNVIGWPHIAVSAANLPDGRILTWASNETTAFPVADQFTHSAIFNPANNSFETTNNPSHDMFCAGISILEDGTILASGGNPQLRNTSVFRTNSLSWSAASLMNQQRWYGTNLTLPNSEVFSTFAKGANNSPEVYSPVSGWTDVPGASMGDLLNEQNTANTNAANDSTTAQWYAFMHVAPDGRVFHSGPTQTMHWFDTAGSGNVVNAGTRLNGDRHRQFGSSVMYDVGKLLVTGGNDRRLTPPSTPTAMTINISGTSPVVSSTQSMQFSRVNHNSVMLPTGEVLVIGGNSSGILFSDSGSAFTPEIWNPQTGQWRAMANMVIPRNYHSLALLMEDGRVLSAGGGLCGNCSANHQDGEIFSPPYLFNTDGTAAVRPAITSNPGSTQAGQFINVSASGNISRFSMIRLSSVTHSINTDQRYIPVDFQAVGENQYELAMNDNPNVLIAGNYWLFAINTEGIPSVGELIRVRR